MKLVNVSNTVTTHMESRHCPLIWEIQDVIKNHAEIYDWLLALK